jgi:COP9 signalosome complex subunit 1
MRAAEHCLTPEHHLALSKNSVKTSLAWGTFAQIHSYVEKAENIPLLNNKDNVPLAAMFKVASGLAALENSRYAEAARKFTDATFEGVRALRDIISIEDVAVYGSLCALAEFSREELKILLSDFHTFLEVVPNVRKMLTFFTTSNYAGSLEILQVFKVGFACSSYLHLQNDLQLDIHMHDHVDRLYTRIRNKALKEYFQPYSSVDLEKMAKAFKTTVPELETELVELINSNHISARIDSFNKVHLTSDHKSHVV